MKIFKFDKKQYNKFNNKELRKRVKSFLICTLIWFSSIIGFVLLISYAKSNKITAVCVVILLILSIVFFFVWFYKLLMLPTYNENSNLLSTCYIIYNDKLYYVEFNDMMDEYVFKTFLETKNPSIDDENYTDIFKCIEITAVYSVEEHIDNFEAVCDYNIFCDYTQIPEIENSIRIKDTIVINKCYKNLDQVIQKLYNIKDK